MHTKENNTTPSHSFATLVMTLLASFGCFLQLVAQQKDEPLPAERFFLPRAGTPHSLSLFTRKKSATVAFLGGSITHNPGWRDQVCAYLSNRFPQTVFYFINAGIPSLGSVPHAFRLQQDVLDSGRIDLLFVEAAVNDRANGTDSLSELRALEGIVRHTRDRNPNTDIVLMAFADPMKSADYDHHNIPAEVRNQEQVAAHYNLPSVNLAQEVHDRMQHLEFDWEHDFKDLHPSPFGQAVYFQAIKALLDKCFDPGLYHHAKSRAPLPGRLTKGPFESGKYVSVDKALTDAHWKLTGDWAPNDALETRPGFVHLPVLQAVTAGAAFDFIFTGSAVGLCVLSGPDAGTIRYRIDGGAAQTMDLFTPWSNALHLPWYVLLAAGLPQGHHQLNVAVESAHNPGSTGTACRIVHLLVN